MSEEEPKKPEETTPETPTKTESEENTKDIKINVDTSALKKDIDNLTSNVDKLAQVVSTLVEKKTKEEAEPSPEPEAPAEPEAPVEKVATKGKVVTESNKDLSAYESMQIDQECSKGHAMWKSQESMPLTLQHRPSAYEELRAQLVEKSPRPEVMR